MPVWDRGASWSVSLFVRMFTCAGMTAVLIGIGAPVMAQASASVTYTYDQAGRLTNAKYDNNTCIAYAYDASGNRVSQNNGSPNPTWGQGFYGCFTWTSATGSKGLRRTGRTASSKSSEADRPRTTAAARPPHVGERQP